MNCVVEERPNGWQRCGNLKIHELIDFTGATRRAEPATSNETSNQQSTTKPVTSNETSNQQ